MGLIDKLKKKKTDHMYLYTDKELDLYEKYIEETFGHFHEVFHEIVSTDIHLDIIIVPPTDKRPYYKLITMGMGAYRMNVPDKWREYELERAELVLYLPSTWNINSSQKEDYWPIRQLKILARLPIECHTWLGYGHTISSDEENTPYANNTQFCSMMLVDALDNQGENLDLRMKTKGKINFYQLFPLYQEELEFKQKHNAETLLNLFDDEDLIPIVNIHRRNYG
ncbi:suppressor of fused domain protein [Massilimicrobiota timonensis]|uniref:suppressor of fused domain protein n=1 Tax=Massilimicrobiota timonensis TaxID=1776392 RepID=UPI0019612087|nr:suppressor of fused domain protein [Massilimicrobiota timonensis]MBM6965116.1 suppressor of fused domain protein [Massilimicrobiota timonensis]